MAETGRTDDFDRLLLLLAASNSADPEWIDYFIRRLSHSGRMSGLLERDPEFMDLLRRRPIYTHERRMRETREIASTVLEGARLSDSKKIDDLEERTSLLLFRLNDLKQQLDARLTASSAELHSFLWLASTGADLKHARIQRYIPARAYVTDPVPSESALQDLVNSVNSLADALGFERAEELPERKGSWFKEWFQRTKKAVTSPEVKETAIILADGQVAKHGWLPQAEVEKVQAETAKLSAESEKIKAEAELARAQAKKLTAEAENLVIDRLQKLQQSIERIPGDVCVQLDRYLCIKSASANTAQTRMLIIYLNDSALKHLAENSAMLERPNEILLWLHQQCAIELPPAQQGKSYSVSFEEPQPLLLLGKKSDR